MPSTVAKNRGLHCFHQWTISPVNCSDMLHIVCFSWVTFLAKLTKKVFRVIEMHILYMSDSIGLLLSLVFTNVAFEKLFSSKGVPFTKDEIPWVWVWKKGSRSPKTGKKRNHHGFQKLKYVAVFITKWEIKSTVCESLNVDGRHSMCAELYSNIHTSM